MQTANEEFAPPPTLWSKKGQRSLTYYVQLDGVTPRRTDWIGDLTLILPGILPLDRVYAEVAVVQGQLHPICELQTLAIEEPMDGDPGVV